MKKIVLTLFLISMTMSLKADDSLNVGLEKHISITLGIGTRILKDNQGNLKSFFNGTINLDLKLYKILFLKTDFDIYDNYNERIEMLSLGPSIKFNLLNINKNINIPLELSLLGMISGSKDGLGFSVFPVISPAIYYNIKNFSLGLN